MTYEDAKAYMEEVSRTGSILGLTNIINLMKELGDVQEKLHILHIAGTNGKGSVGAFIESVLMEAGYRVGRYTSPAVFEPFEVWRINQHNIRVEDYLECLEEVKTACEHMQKKGMVQPTVFEIETALAFLYFYKNNCDYVLLEVGMGGETDATNLITAPVCSIITSISMDHMQFLGNTLAEIAHVKAGIIKEGCPVVTGSTQKAEAMREIQTMAEYKGARILIAEESQIKNIEIALEGISYEHEWLGKVQLKLSGMYQIENSNLAIIVCKKVLHIPTEIIVKGIKKTTWPGRFEVVSKKPLVILDGAHNEDAAEKLFTTLKMHFTNQKITYIIGVLADKEHEKMLSRMLPLAERVFTVTPPNKRALAGESLAEEVRSFGCDAVYCESMEQAAELALANVKEDGVILAFGSLSYLAVLKEAFLSRV